MSAKNKENIQKKGCGKGDDDDESVNDEYRHRMQYHHYFGKVFFCKCCVPSFLPTQNIKANRNKTFARDLENVIHFHVVCA